MKNLQSWKQKRNITTKFLLGKSKDKLYLNRKRERVYRRIDFIEVIGQRVYINPMTKYEMKET